jgi:5-formyltetrahydrofolate cyclo-ligase
MGGVIGTAKSEWRRAVAERLRAEAATAGFDQKRVAAERAVVAWCAEQVPKGAVVTLFGGLPREVDLMPRVMPALRALGLRTAAFALDEARAGEMVAMEVREVSDLRRGRMGVWEPVRVAEREVPAEMVHTVLVPGLAFCPQSGFRVGRGGGYFDRFLSRVRPETLRVGVALECQVREGVPREAHDMPVQWLVTEQRVRRVEG